MRRVCKRGLRADCHMCGMSASEGCVLIATCLAVLCAQVACLVDTLSIGCQARGPTRPDIASLPPLRAKCTGGRFGSTRNPACEKTGLSGRRTPSCVFDPGTFAPPAKMKVC